MNVRFILTICAVTLCLPLLTACPSATVGGGSDAAASGSTGSGGGNGSVELKRCAKSYGTTAITTAHGFSGRTLVQFGLPADPLPAMRLIAQQSGCFQVVHRDVVLKTMETERRLAESGQLAKGSAFGKGQMVAADYTLLVEVIVNNPNKGGIGAGLLNFVPYVGLLAGGLKFSEAQVQLTLVDNRTGVQKSVAIGKAEATSFGGLGFGVTGNLGLGAGGYTNTAQGRVVMGAMVDAHNKLQKHFQ